MLALELRRGTCIMVGVVFVCAIALHAAQAAKKPDRFEIGVVPIIGGNTDVGFSVGAVGAVTRFRRGFEPYRWRSELVALVSFKTRHGGTYAAFQDYAIEPTFPQLGWERLRLAGRLSYTSYTDLPYDGLGNVAQRDPEDTGDYDLAYPEARLAARFRTLRHVHVIAGAFYRYALVTVRQGSSLADDLSHPPVGSAGVLVGARDHAVAMVFAGLVWDSRDDETAPTRGSLHELTWRGAPALGAVAPYGYGGLHLRVGSYTELAGRAVVLAVRGVADGLTGSPPFYELARLRDGTAAPGGGESVRGVPAYRYYGKVKVFGNVELRFAGRAWRVLGQEIQPGAVAFFDAGRVFLDWQPAPRFDGAGTGLKIGIGGGLRLRWGETFVLRSDVAWSPDADPIAVYFDVGHVF